MGILNVQITAFLCPALNPEELIVPPQKLTYSFDTTAVERDIHAMRMQRADIMEEHVVQAGDFVELLQGSEKEPIPLTVGKGLFDPDLEALLVGCEKGASLRFGQETYRILSVRRRVVPEFSDRMAQEEGYASEEDYRKRHEQELKDAITREKASDLSISLLQNEVQRPNLADPKNETEELANSYRQLSELLLKSRGLDWETADPDELEKALGWRDAKEAEQRYRKTAESNLKAAIVGKKLADKQGIVLTEEEYRDFVRHDAEKYLLDESEYTKAVTPFAFAVNRYIGILLSELRKKLESQMQEV